MGEMILRYVKPRNQDRFTEDQEEIINSYHKKGVTAKELTEILGLPLDKKTIKRVSSKAQRMGVSLGKRIKK
jgi:hypothetical protein